MGGEGGECVSGICVGSVLGKRRGCNWGGVGCWNQGGLSLGLQVVYEVHVHGGKENNFWGEDVGGVAQPLLTTHTYTHTYAHTHIHTHTRARAHTQHFGSALP